MKIEKIDTSKIRGNWQENIDGMLAGGNDTIPSIQLCADKINELVEAYNKLAVSEQSESSANSLTK